MIVSDIFSTETPKLINLFFEKFDEPEVKSNQSFISQEDLEEDEEKIPEDVNVQEEEEKSAEEN
jgi:hypothetical protein